MPNETLESTVETIPFLSEQFAEKNYFMSYVSFQEKFGFGEMTAYIGAYLKYHPLPQKHLRSILNNEFGMGSRVLDMLPSEFWSSQLPNNILETIQGLVAQDLKKNGIELEHLGENYYIDNKEKIDRLKFHQCEKYLFGLFDNVFRKIYDEQGNLQRLIARELPQLKDNENVRKNILNGVMISFSSAITEIYSTQKVKTITGEEFTYQVWNPISNILAQNDMVEFANRTAELETFITKANIKLVKLQKELSHISFNHPRFGVLNDRATLLKELIKNNENLVKHKIFLTATYTHEQKEKLTQVLYAELIEFTRVLGEAEKKLASGIDEIVKLAAKKSQNQDTEELDSLVSIEAQIKKLISKNQELINKGGDVIAMDYLDQQESDLKSLLEKVRTNEVASHHSPIVRLINAILSIFTDWQIRTPVEAAAKEMDNEINRFQLAH